MRDLFRNTVGAGRRTVALCGVLCIPALALTGCAGSQADDPTLPSPLSSPRQQDLDAATFRDIFSQYVGLPFGMMTEANLSPLLADSLLAEDLKEIAQAKENHTKVIGKGTFSNFSVTDHGVDDQKKEYMVAQACLDVTGTRFQDVNGRDVTPSRPPRISQQIKAVKQSDGNWKMTDIVRNEGVKACD